MHEDDDDFHRQETIVEKSDRMAREVSKRREIRLREERVRLLADAPARTQKHKSRSSPRAPDVPVDHTNTVPVGPPPEEGQPRDTDPVRPPRLSDPFPPIPNKPASRPQQDAPAPGSQPLMQQAQQGQLDVLAVELEELMRTFRHGWRNAAGADKVGLISSTMMLLGLFAPWTSRVGAHLELGIFAGGGLHTLVAVAACIVIIRSARAFDGLRGPPGEQARRYRRGGLILVLLGTASTVLCVFFLVLWTISTKLNGVPVDIHAGFYWTLAWGTGVSYGGYARFSGVKK